MWATPVAKTAAKRAPRAHQPLDKHVAAMRASFAQKRHEVPQLRARIAELEQRRAGFTRRFERRMALDIDDAIRELQQEIETRENMVRENEYEQMIGPYMRAYNQRVEVEETSTGTPRNIAAPGNGGKKRETIDGFVQQYDATAQRQTAILDEYQSEANGCAPKLTLRTRDDCPLCKQRLMLVSAKSMLTCSSCGYSIAYLDATMQAMSYTDEVEFSSFSYKRINHFNEWLQQVQAKESFEVSQEMMDAIMRELYRQRVTKVDDITPKRVREVLKTLKLRKAYEHVAQITSRLTGTPPLRVPVEIEEKCRLMFIAVQPAFEKHCPKDRKNFLSYSYCLYKFFQLLGYDDFLESFTLLKGRDKLARQDEIFKKICEELEWEFVPSI